MAQAAVALGVSANAAQHPPPSGEKGPRGGDLAAAAARMPLPHRCKRIRHPVKDRCPPRHRQGMNENFDDPAQRLRLAAQSSPAAPRARRRARRQRRRSPGPAPRASRVEPPAVRGRARRGRRRLGGRPRGAGSAWPPPPRCSPRQGGPRPCSEAAALSADSKIAALGQLPSTSPAPASERRAADGHRVRTATRGRTGLQVLADAADALGLEGDAVTASYSSAEYPSYIIGSEDGSAASLCCRGRERELVVQRPRGLPGAGVRAGPAREGGRHLDRDVPSSAASPRSPPPSRSRPERR